MGNLLPSVHVETSIATTLSARESSSLVAAAYQLGGVPGTAEFRGQYMAEFRGHGVPGTVYERSSGESICNLRDYSRRPVNAATLTL